MTISFRITKDDVQDIVLEGNAVVVAEENFCQKHRSVYKVERERMDKKNVFTRDI